MGSAFGWLRDLLGLGCNKVYFCVREGEKPVHWRVVKKSYFGDKDRELKVGRGDKAKVFVVKSEGFAYHRKGEYVFFKDWDTGAQIYLSGLDYIVGVKGQLITPEELEASGTTRDTRAAMKVGSAGDWMMVLLGLGQVCRW